MQTAIADRLTASLQENKGVTVTIDRVSLTYLGRLKLNGIYVEDHHGDTLVMTREVRTSLLSVARLVAGSPYLGSTSIEGMRMKMRRYRGEERDNLSLLLEKLRSRPTGDSSAFTLGVSSVQVTNSHFSYIDEDLDYPRVVILDSLFLNTDDLEVNGDEIRTDIKLLRGQEHRGIRISNLSTDFFYSPTRMELDDLELQTTESILKGAIIMDYQLEDFADFKDRVQFTADFEESMVSSSDLKGFYQDFGPGQLLRFRTGFRGSLNDFILEGFDLKGMDRSRVVGNLSVQGAFSEAGKHLRISGNFREFTSNYYDLVNLLPGDLQGRLPEKLRDFGNINVHGTATLTRSSLRADAEIHSQLGNGVADFLVENFGDPAKASYKGNLVFEDLNVGKLVDDPLLGRMSFNMDFDGAGFDQENLSTHLEGKITKLEYNRYTYSNIRVIGNLREPVFNGYLMAGDPNLRMEFNGLADLSQETNVYDFEASVSYADLHALHFITRDSISVFKGDVFMNMRGTSMDDATGEIMLLNTSYRNQNDLYFFDDLSITSEFEGEIRSIAVNSPDVISGEVRGNFRLSEVGALFQNSLGSIYTNYQPETITNNQFMEFDFDIYNKIVEVFYPKITLAPNTFIRGRVESDESEFKVTFRSPRIDAFGNMFQQVNLKVDNTNPIYNTYFEADSVATDFYNFSEFSFINVTLRDTLFIRSEFQGGKNNDDVFNLNLYHTINQDNKSVVGIQRSDIRFRENLWYINETGDKSNRIIFENNFRDIQVDSLVMSHGKERIRLSGMMRDSTYKDFRMVFEEVGVGKITPHIDSLDLAGTLNGRFDLLQEKGAYYPNTSLRVDSLQVNQTHLGDLDIEVKGNEDLTDYAIAASLKKDGLESLKALGGIQVSGGDPRIDLDMDLQRLNAAAFSPLGGQAISNIRGYASGKASMRGDYKNPTFSGELRLEEAGLWIPYLNVDLDFVDNSLVQLTDQQFNFDDVQIVDTKYRTRGILNGSISHRYFREWFLNLNIHSDRLLVLDTQGDVDALYYGTAFISGDAAITGPTDQLLIEVTATTERGTVFKIPLDETESAGDNSYIHFLSPEEKVARLAGEEVQAPEVKGIELVFDLDVTNDAEVEVVVDQTSGSTLRGRGAGNLLLEINTNGKFNMWGDFVAYEGVYNFKYAGLVQKIFRVESGGSINWDGSPTRAQLDVRAIYELAANPAVLLENPSINRKIPVEVIIDLQGEIAQPDITFEIEFPNASSVVRSELEYRIDDRAARELQALFLVTQGSFYSEFGLRQNAITGTLAERASSLVNDIFADEDGKFQVGVNYVQGDRSPDQQAVDRFGLTLSTRISDRVIINGQVGVPIGGVTESVIVGDLEIDFLLNEDGSLRAKVFNRENNIQFIGEEIGFTQGIGLSYSVDFDTFRELLRRIMDAELSRRKEEEEARRQPDPVPSLAPDYITFPEEGRR